MKKKVLIINMWVCTVWGIFVALYYYFKEADNAEWQIILLAVAVPSVIATIVTLYISRK